MILPESFHFLRPIWLAALLPLGVVLWLFARRRLRSRGWEAVCDPALLPHVLLGRTGSARKFPLALAAVAGTLAVLALAGPVWRQLPQPLYTGGGALVIALDLSRSMDAADLRPSRLVRARFKVADILSRRQEGQTALLVFAGEAFTVTPLTDDVETIRSQLTALDTDIMPAAGSRGDRALALAGDLLRHAGLDHGSVLLVTDEAGAGAVDVAQVLKDSGFRVYVLGVGTERGAPVALPGGGFLKSDDGEIVVPGLDEAALRAVASAGGGAFAELTVDDADLDALAGMFAAGPESGGETSRSEFRADLWQEEGPWLVLLLLPIAALAFRRGYLFVLPLLLLAPPRPADASGWDDLWLRSDQQGQRALEAGDAARAAELFRDPAWAGAARYRAGDYDGAAEVLKQSADVEALYNRGNALARGGRVDEAIAAYSEVLRRDPGHEDARYNKELLEKEKNREQENQQNQQGGQNQQGQQGQQDQQGQQQAENSGSNAAPDGNQEGAQDATQDPSRGDAGSGQASPDQNRQESEDPQGAGGETPTEPDGRAEDKPPSPAAPDEGRTTPKEESEHASTMRAEKGDAAEGDRQQAAAMDDETDTPDEEQLAAEQWLRRIPDDPGGLLRRKFRYQHQQRAEAPAPGEQTW